MKEDISLNEHDYKSSEEASLLQATRGQRKIGWKAMPQGIVHIGWANREKQYMETNGTENKKNSIIRWKRLFLQVLTDYSLSCWKMRNETLHGANAEEGREIKLKRLQEKVRNLYGKKRNSQNTKKMLICNVYAQAGGIRSILFYVMDRKGRGNFKTT